MKRQKYIFKWVLSAGYDVETNTFNESLKAPTTAIGSSSIRAVDGRLNLNSIRNIAEQWIAQNNGIGYSVGYLTTHDPDNVLSQSIIKFTKVLGATPTAGQIKI